MAISRTQLAEELGTGMASLFIGHGLPNKLRFVKGNVISRSRLLSRFPKGVYLKWIDFYEVEFNGCIGNKVIIGDE